MILDWRWFAIALCLSLSAEAQVFKVSPEQSPEKKADRVQSAPPQKDLGWGSNIQNARLARAAELALKDGKYAAALDYAPDYAPVGPKFG